MELKGTFSTRMLETCSTLCPECFIITLDESFEHCQHISAERRCLNFARKTFAQRFIRPHEIFKDHPEYRQYDSTHKFLSAEFPNSRWQSSSCNPKHDLSVKNDLSRKSKAYLQVSVTSTCAQVSVQHPVNHMFRKLSVYRPTKDDSPRRKPKYNANAAQPEPPPRQDSCFIRHEPSQRGLYTAVA